MPAFRLRRRRFQLFREMRVLVNCGRGLAYGPHATDNDGRGRPVNGIPRFLARDDRSEAPPSLSREFRHLLLGRGGAIRGKKKSDLLARLDSTSRLYRRGCDAPCAGSVWSLGGLIAREYAKYAPDVSIACHEAAPFGRSAAPSRPVALYD